MSTPQPPKGPEAGENSEADSKEFKEELERDRRLVEQLGGDRLGEDRKRAAAEEKGNAEAAAARATTLSSTIPKSILKKPKTVVSAGEAQAAPSRPEVTMQPQIKPKKVQFDVEHDIDTTERFDENTERLDPLRAPSPYATRHRGITSGFNHSRATPQTGFPGRVAATANSNEPMIKASYERIKQNILDAAMGKRLEETQIYKDTKVKIIREDHNNLKLSMEYENGKIDEISRAINPTTHQMTAVLSRNAEDKSFFMFCDINNEFQPLHMKPCNDVQIVLKVFEASIQMGVKIEISEADKVLLNKPENTSLKAHFDLLTNEPEKFKKWSTDAGSTRRLGQPFSPLQFTSGPSSTP